jgi:hypothetical protein
MRLRRSTAAGSPDAPPTLIGVDDLKTPWWAQVGEEMVSSGPRRMLLKAPAALAVIVRLAWQASPRLTLLAAAVQLASGCTTAFGLLATANVLARLLEQGPTPQRVLAALPALVLVMASYAARGCWTRRSERCRRYWPREWSCAPRTSCTLRLSVLT